MLCFVLFWKKKQLTKDLTHLANEKCIFIDGWKWDRYIWKVCPSIAEHTCQMTIFNSGVLFHATYWKPVRFALESRTMIYKTWRKLNSWQSHNCLTSLCRPRIRELHRKTIFRVIKCFVYLFSFILSIICLLFYYFQLFYYGHSICVSCLLHSFWPPLNSFLH